MVCKEILLNKCIIQIINGVRNGIASLRVTKNIFARSRKYGVFNDFDFMLGIWIKIDTSSWRTIQKRYDNERPPSSDNSYNSTVNPMSKIAICMQARAQSWVNKGNVTFQWERSSNQYANFDLLRSVHLNF